MPVARLVGVWAVVLVTAIAACSRPEERAHRADILGWRAARDAYMRGGGSPLLPEQRARFRGLDYYAVDARWVFEGGLETTAAAETLVFVTSKNTFETYLRLGRFRFAIDGREHALTIFRALASDDLFLPFTDATSGRETYGAGRYVDPEVLGGGRYRIDFNRAYNPYCAYNDAWVCPLAPRENHIDARLTAGEKSFRDGR